MIKTTMLVTFLAAAFFRQNDRPVAAEQGLQQFVPRGYAILDSTYGDLNLDRYPDAILVLRRENEEALSKATEDPVKRPLLILLGQAGNKYTLAARSDNAVYCSSCGGMMGDPYQGITIRNGYFSVEHYGGSAWRWTRIVTFKYAPADRAWYLHKDGGDSFHATDPEKVTTTVRTTKDFGKVAFGRFDIYKEE
ncbi:hypothetical protein ACWKWU_04250 [Chitinophaga lutea]